MLKPITITLFIYCIICISNLKAKGTLSANVIASYFGGSDAEYMVYNAVDKSGNIIIAGHTNSADLPAKKCVSKS